MASKHIPHTASTSKALYTIFIQPALTASRTPTRPQLHALTFNRNATKPAAAAAAPLTRSFTTTRSLQFSKKKPAPTAVVREQKWNEEITARYITLVNPSTDKLDEPVTRFSVLSSLDLKTHRLVQLTTDDVPVCKIVSKKEEYAHDKETQRSAENYQKRRREGKECENAGIELGD
jgi:translation initiation factor IF-3